MKKEYMTLLGAGFFSGVINALLSSFEISYTITLLFGAGIFYGIVTGIYFSFVADPHCQKKYRKMFAWTVFSAVSYLLAVKTTLSSSQVDLLPNPGLFGYFSGGLVGTLTLFVAFHFLYKKNPLGNWLSVTACGALLPPLLFFFFKDFSWMGFELTSLLYLFWQTMVTVLLGLSLFEEKGAR